MIKVDVLVTNKNWNKYIKNPNIYLVKRLKKVQKEISLIRKNNINFTLLLSGEQEIKKLNKKFRKKNKSTDVLSFPSHEKKILLKLLKKKNYLYLGDIIINLTKIIKLSKTQDFMTVFDKIWIHGLVHLLGYRHKSNKDFLVMQKIENKIIKSFK
tara:strand:+ start:217 stop:681 length:465 start_codon:yes stop_codon:yes gene_type:complete